MMISHIRRCFSGNLSHLTPLQLYKYLWRECDKLPSEAANYYKFQIKQSYKQYKQEVDPERIQHIINKSIQDAEWIVNKYKRKQ